MIKDASSSIKLLKEIMSSAVEASNQAIKRLVDMDSELGHSNQQVSDMQKIKDTMNKKNPTEGV